MEKWYSFKKSVNGVHCIDNGREQFSNCFRSKAKSNIQESTLMVPQCPFWCLFLFSSNTNLKNSIQSTINTQFSRSNKRSSSKSNESEPSHARISTIIHTHKSRSLQREICLPHFPEYFSGRDFSRWPQTEISLRIQFGKRPLRWCGSDKSTTKWFQGLLLPSVLCFGFSRFTPEITVCGLLSGWNASAVCLWEFARECWTFILFHCVNSENHSHMAAIN